MSESRPCDHGYVYGCPECPKETRALVNRQPDGELLDRLEELAVWLDENAPVDHSTPWLVRRDLVREAARQLAAEGQQQEPEQGWKPIEEIAPIDAEIMFGWLGEYAEMVEWHAGCQVWVRSADGVRVEPTHIHRLPDPPSQILRPGHTDEGHEEEQRTKKI